MSKRRRAVTKGRRALPRRSTRARRAAPVDQQARTVKAKARFLREYAIAGNVLRSAIVAKVGRRTVYDWVREDAAFSAAYLEATEDAGDRCEAEVHRRAVEGWDEPVYQGGKRVGTIRKYSDRLLELRVKALRPDKYRERIEHTGDKGGPIKLQKMVRVVFNTRKPEATT